MRSFHPSGKAVLVAGALAVTLVVGATSGAVAGRLITSQDIKNGTIKPVDLSKGVRADLKKAGTPGPGGAQGPAGAQGHAGAQGVAGPAGKDGTNGTDGAEGPVGAPGDGSLVVTRSYDRVADEEPETDDIPLVRLEGDGSPIELTTGNYLVSVQGLFSSFDGGPSAGLLVLGDGAFEDEPLTLMRSCVGFYVPVCNATVPVTVQADETFDLNVYWASFLGGCSSDCEAETPAIATVSVYKVGGALAAPSSLDPCGLFGCSDEEEAEEEPLRRQLAQLEQQLRRSAR